MPNEFGLNVGGIKVNISDNLINNLKNLNQIVVTQAFADKLGKVIVDGAKDAISKGISPVRDVGRFEAYKDPKKYPGNRKPARPVNLYLTGEMLSFLNYRKVGSKLFFGIFSDEAPEKVMLRVDTHNRGTHPHVPRRQFIPESGQEFIVSIQVLIRKLYSERLSEVVSRLIK